MAKQGALRWFFHRESAIAWIDSHHLRHSPFPQQAVNWFSADPEYIWIICRHNPKDAYDLQHLLVNGRWKSELTKQCRYHLEDIVNNMLHRETSPLNIGKADEGFFITVTHNAD